MACKPKHGGNRGEQTTRSIAADVQKEDRGGKDGNARSNQQNRRGTACPSGGDDAELHASSRTRHDTLLHVGISDQLERHPGAAPEVDFDLSYAQAMLVQFAFFSAYFLFSVPGSKIVNRAGYQRTMV